MPPTPVPTFGQPIGIGDLLQSILQLFSVVANALPWYIWGLFAIAVIVSIWSGSVQRKRRAEARRKRERRESLQEEYYRTMIEEKKGKGSR
jgi:hypothetical protein